MSRLYYKYGAMNSGKTAHLLQAAHNYEENGMKIVILKPEIICIFLNLNESSYKNIFSWSFWITIFFSSSVNFIVPNSFLLLHIFSYLCLIKILLLFGFESSFDIISSAFSSAVLHVGSSHGQIFLPFPDA